MTSVLQEMFQLNSNSREQEKTSTTKVVKARVRYGLLNQFLAAKQQLYIL